MRPTVAIVCFPGSNCEHDVAEALRRLGAEPVIVWHTDSLGEPDAIVIPGGFAHGDYLRPGAIAAFSPVMKDVRDHAQRNGPVLGICNGFQVLTESGLLQGALMRNSGLRFLCETVECTVESELSVLTEGVAKGTQLQLPINHYEGNFYANDTDIAALESAGRVVLRYGEDVNGARNKIAGVANDGGNVVGLMPHPERASSALLKSSDGNVLLEAFVRSATAFSSGQRSMSARSRVG